MRALNQEEASKIRGLPEIEKIAKVYLIGLAILSFITSITRELLIASIFPALEFIGIISVGIILDPIEKVYECKDKLARAFSLSTFIILYYIGSGIFNDVYNYALIQVISDVLFLSNIFFITLLGAPVLLILLKKRSGKHIEFVITLVKNLFEKKYKAHLDDNAVRFTLDLLRTKRFRALYYERLYENVFATAMTAFILVVFMVGINFVVEFYSNINTLIGMSIGVFPFLVSLYTKAREKISKQKTKEVVLPVDEEVVIDISSSRVSNIFAIVLLILYFLLFPIPGYALITFFAINVFIYLVTYPATEPTLLNDPTRVLSLGLTLGFEFISGIFLLYLSIHYVSLLLKNRNTDVVSARYQKADLYLLIISLILAFDFLTSSLFEGLIPQVPVSILKWLYLIFSIGGYMAIIKYLLKNKKVITQSLEDFINNYVIGMLLLAVPPSILFASLLWSVTNSKDLLLFYAAIQATFIGYILIMRSSILIYRKNEKMGALVLILLALLGNIAWAYDALTEYSNSLGIMLSIFGILLIIDIYTIFVAAFIFLKNSKRFFKDVIFAIPLAKTILLYFSEHYAILTKNELAQKLNAPIEKVSYALDALYYLDIVKVKGEGDESLRYYPMKKYLRTLKKLESKNA